MFSTIFFEVIFLSLIVLVSISVTRPIFIKKNFLDHTNYRKNHGSPTPINGGISMLIGLLVGLIFIFSNYEANLILIICSLIICVLGFTDDVSELSPGSRIYAQIIICLIAFSYGHIEITSFGDVFGFGELNFNRLALIITVIALLTAMNSFNLIDGIDGLSSGIAIVVFSSILFLFMLSNGNTFTNISLIYLSILIPFFLVNISKAKIFMGDSGSLLIGFGIGWLLIESSQGENAFINPVTNLWIFAVPLFDIISVIILRIKSNKSIFRPDKRHIHNLLINKLKISQKKVLIILLTISALFASIGILMQVQEVAEWIMFYSLFALLLIYLLFTNTLEKKSIIDN